MARDTMDVLCACGHERRLHADGSGWCVRCDCERFETLLAKHQPAAVAPRLSEARERRLRMVADDADPAAPMPVLFAELDATRVDLTRTRAEADAARTERDDARRWAVRLEQRLAAETAAAYRLLLANAPPWFAAPQSEQQPAAPVDRSAEAEGPETVRCHVCDVEIAAICDDCLKLVHDRMHELLALGHQPCCRLLGWWPYMGAYVSGHHPHCKTPTTPPDHHVGDEP